jgi:hypothetical protein
MQIKIKWISLKQNNWDLKEVINQKYKKTYLGDKHMVLFKVILA